MAGNGNVAVAMDLSSDAIDVTGKSEVASPRKERVEIGMLPSNSSAPSMPLTGLGDDIASIDSILPDEGKGEGNLAGSLDELPKSSLVESMHGTMSQGRKRKYGIGDDAGDAKALPKKNRGPRNKFASPDKPRQQGPTLFEDRCNSLYQQNMETLNSNFGRWAEQTLNLRSREKTAATGSHEPPQVYLHPCCVLCCEYRRCAEQIKQNYKPETGNVLVCGSNDCNQLGPLPTDTNLACLAVIANLTDLSVTRIAAGGLHNAATTSLGKLITWGANDEGQLGRATANDYEQLNPTDLSGCIPSKYALYKGDLDKIQYGNEDESIIDVQCGDCHTLALSITGRVYMFGSYKTAKGKFVRDPRPMDDTTVDPPPGEDAPQEVGIKGRHFNPTHVYLMPGKVKSIHCGLYINSAIIWDKSGNEEIVTWGIGDRGELGRRTGDFPGDKDANYQQIVVENFLTPKPISWSGPSSIKRTVLTVACGGFHMLAVAREHGQEDTTTYSSGLNKYGQLGHGDHGDETDRLELTPIRALQGKNIFKVSAGKHHSTCLDMTGSSLYAWGRADYGQIGIHEKKVPAWHLASTPQLVFFPRKMHPSRSHIFRVVIFIVWPCRRMEISTHGELVRWDNWVTEVKMTSFVPVTCAEVPYGTKRRTSTLALLGKSRVGVSI